VRLGDNTNPLGTTTVHSSFLSAFCATATSANFNKIALRHLYLKCMVKVYYRRPRTSRFNFLRLHLSPSFSTKNSRKPTTAKSSEADYKVYGKVRRPMKPKQTEKFLGGTTVVGQHGSRSHAWTSPSRSCLNYPRPNQRCIRTSVDQCCDRTA
jgi:hypothetical protein